MDTPLLGTSASAVAPPPPPVADDTRQQLREKMQQARAYVWMHSRVAPWQNRYAAASTLLLSLLSFASGCITITHVGGGDASTITGSIVSLVVSTVLGLLKTSYFNFEDAAARNESQIESWNNFWAGIESALSESRDLRSVNSQFAALETISERLLPLWARRECVRALPDSVLPDMCRDAVLVCAQTEAIPPK